MNKLSRTLFVAIWGISTLVGCSKEDAAAPVTTMEMTVKDNLGKIVEGATVRLYGSEEDWNAETNQVGFTEITDESGKAVFTDLDPKKYYWLIEKGCLNNINGAYTTTTPLEAKKITRITCIVRSTGSVTLINTSTDPYLVHIDGDFQFRMAPNSSFTYRHLPIGSYGIRVVQASGFDVYPTDETYSTVVTCGEMATVAFPN